MDDLNQTKIVANLRLAKLVYKRAISAGGCLFYKTGTDPRGLVQLLLIRYTNPDYPSLDDLGGKTDLEDRSILETIYREVEEETNNLITRERIFNALLPKASSVDGTIAPSSVSSFYNERSKYYLLLIRVDEDFFPDTTVFGVREHSDDIGRTIDWWPFDEARDRLSHRLANNDDLMRHLGTANSGTSP